MAHALIQAGSVSAYPYTMRQLLLDHPNTSFPELAAITPALLESYGVYDVASSSKPSYDAITQGARESTPTLVGAVWTQSWEVYALTQSEIDANNAAAKDADDAAAAKSYAKLTSLKGMTPAQIGAWVDANVTSLSGAQDAIKTLAIAVGIIARKI